MYTKSSEHINVEVNFTFQGSNIAAITVADLAIHVYDSFLTCNNSCMIALALRLSSLPTSVAITYLTYELASHIRCNFVFDLRAYGCSSVES